MVEREACHFSCDNACVGLQPQRVPLQLTFSGLQSGAQQSLQNLGPWAEQNYISDPGASPNGF